MCSVSFLLVWILVTMLTVESVFRGYNLYKNDWCPSVGDEFELETEELNRHDRYAVAIKVSVDIVGHVPRKFFRIVYCFIKNGGRATGELCTKGQKSAIHMEKVGGTMSIQVSLTKSF